MAWIEKPRQFWQLRDRIGGRKINIIKNLGIRKGVAEVWKVKYLDALSRGLEPRPNMGPKVIEAFLEGKDSGEYKRIKMPELCDLFAKNHRPSLKKGKGQQNFDSFMRKIRAAWPNKYSDELHALDVRDFLAQFTTTGTVMRYLGLITSIFVKVDRWNEREVLVPKIKIPKHNPGNTWRSDMKSSAKIERPRTRVLSVLEWQHFISHLKPRTLAICKVGLQRFLRQSDIQKMSTYKIKNGFIEGLQEKTGRAFSVPVLSDQPTRYNFKNFRKDFVNAQKAAGMHFPKDDPRHFTFRDLRRTGATWGYRKTKDLAGVSEMLGHTTTKTSKIYLNISNTDKNSIALAVDSLAQQDPAD